MLTLLSPCNVNTVLNAAAPPADWRLRNMCVCVYVHISIYTGSGWDVINFIHVIFCGSVDQGWLRHQFYIYC